MEGESRHNIVRHGARTCQSLRGPEVDAAVSDFIVAAVNGKNIALALAVREQVRADYAAADRQHANRIEALRTEADMARRRYLAVDPSNRLVGATLEAEWNARLETLTRAVAEREQLAKAHERTMSAEQDERIMELARDFGRVWNAPTTSSVDRKRLLALLVEDATLTREGYRATVGLRLRGGKTHTLQVDLPRPYYVTMQRMPRDKDVRLELELHRHCGTAFPVTAAVGSRGRTPRTGTCATLTRIPTCASTRSGRWNAASRRTHHVSPEACPPANRGQRLRGSRV